MNKQPDFATLSKGPSIDSYTIDRIKHISNTEVVRRLLIKYFVDKGFNSSFDRQMYPALIQDLPNCIPVLSSKIEIIPYAEEIDISLGRVILGWNMFVLGNKRMYLGETYHNNLHDLARQIRSGPIQMPEQGMANARRQTTPRRIVTFLSRVLGDNAAGYVDLSPTTRPVRPIGEPYAARQSMMGMSQQFFARN